MGDKSGIVGPIHEIAHSWTGNLITNMNWDCFWLNEGFTTFIERKTVKALIGLAQSLMDSNIGNSSMYSAMVSYGMNHQFSSLTPRVGN